MSSDDEGENQVPVGQLLAGLDVDEGEGDMAADLQAGLAHLEDVDSAALDDTETALADVAQAHNSDIENLAGAVDALTQVVTTLLKRRREGTLEGGEGEGDSDTEGAALRSFQ